jgi:GDP-D-mannose 3',5'-epimerase
MKRILVMGSGGFIGGHLVRRQTELGNFVVGIDVKEHEFGINPEKFLKQDLTNQSFLHEYILNEGHSFDEIYQLAADMGGAGYIFSGANDANVMLNSGLINMNLLSAIVRAKKERKKNFETKVFFSSSACIYPEHTQREARNPDCREETAYPANPDSEYGWEKLYSERLYFAVARNFDLNVKVARFHNIYGPHSTWTGGREKSPAALCRKVAESQDKGEIEIWGDGEQTRSFLYVDDCIEAILQFMSSNFSGPVNIGSEEMISINDMAHLIMKIANKSLKIKHVNGPLGVRGRNSHNELFNKEIGYEYRYSLEAGLKETYDWISREVIKSQAKVYG